MKFKGEESNLLESCKKIGCLLLMHTHDHWASGSYKKRLNCWLVPGTLTMEQKNGHLHIIGTVATSRRFQTEEKLYG